MTGTTALGRLCEFAQTQSQRVLVMLNSPKRVFNTAVAGRPRVATQSSRPRPISPQKSAHLTHRQRNFLLGIFPRIHAHLGFRRQHRGFHGDDIGMRRRVVRHHQHGRLAGAHDIARHAVYEVGAVTAVHALQKTIHCFRRDLGPLLGERGTPAFHVAVVSEGRRLFAEAHGL